MPTYLKQHVRTTNDTNGNPRRCWVVYEIGGADIPLVVARIDEGYQGLGAVRAWEKAHNVHIAGDLEDVDVSPRYYCSALKASVAEM